MATSDYETSIASAVDSGDARHVLGLVESVDWRAVDAAIANRVLQLIALYGYSGRTTRYVEAIRAMLALGCQPNLATCALLCENDLALQLLEIDPGAIHETDDHDATALHHAAERGNTELVGRLCKLGADPNAVDEAGQMPIDKALHAGPWKTELATEVVALLRRQGADVDFWTQAAIGDAESLTAVLNESSTQVNDMDPKVLVRGKWATIFTVKSNS